MSKTRVTVFLCTGKDCRKAWARAGAGSPAKWLKRQVEKAGLPYKLHVVQTECMDRCDEAACLCAVCGDGAGFVTEVRSEEDADRALATLRSCVETAAALAGRPGESSA
jgi:hypothetical protein